MAGHQDRVQRALDAAGELAVERDLFVSPGAAEIVDAVDSFCRVHLGSALAGYEFFWSGVGSVHGVRLADDRAVVIKVHAPWLHADVLNGIHTVRRYLFQRGFPTPEPLLGPTPLGLGTATVEELVPRGPLVDGHDPGVRRLLAVALARLIDETRPFGRDAQLPAVVPFRRLYPVPHRRQVDLDGTAAGAAWIDELAVEARMRHRDEGRHVVGHADWRTENLAVHPGAVTAVFDWDSLRYELEPVLVGHAAAAHTADTRLVDHLVAPTPDEVRSFVDAYEDATGHRFRGAARSTLFAAATYYACYTARCEHAADPDGEPPLGSYRRLIAEHAGELINS